MTKKTLRSEPLTQGDAQLFNPCSHIYVYVHISLQLVPNAPAAPYSGRGSAYKILAHLVICGCRLFCGSLKTLCGDNFSIPLAPPARQCSRPPRQVRAGQREGARRRAAPGSPATASSRPRMCVGCARETPPGHRPALPAQGRGAPRLQEPALQTTGLSPLPFTPGTRTTAKPEPVS